MQLSTELEAKEHTSAKMKTANTTPISQFFDLWKNDVHKMEEGQGTHR